jgi:NodT family efflux transporter outer membrane factor (OMF) lipoprotein
MKTNKKLSAFIGIILLAILHTSCTLPELQTKKEKIELPTKFNADSTNKNSAEINWRDFFNDTNLIDIIDTALVNNQELNILLQEILITNNEVMARKGEYLPSVNLNIGAGAEKVGRYTSQGANDANTEIAAGREFPEPLTDMMLSANASWELDIWRKLRNAKDAAVKRYISSIEGRNFVITQLISEIASSYFELLALDNQLEILKSNIDIQNNALNIVRLQKQAGKVTELAVKKFEAEVLKNKSLIFNIQQKINVTENKINFLVGRYPQKIKRNSEYFNKLVPESIATGIPSQLLENRPDVRQAELEIEASELDLKSAKANFYPALKITAGLGYQGFSPSFLFQTPESMIYGLAGELLTPLVNRNAIEATYLNANSKQIQAIYNYEKVLLNAYVEVANQISNIDNLQNSYRLREQQVDTLILSIDISTKLFKSARADYMEVMLTQRDALEARFDLIETKQQQLNGLVSLYKALGGGWK